MFPLRVDSTSDAARMGAGNFLSRQRGFNDGVKELGASLGKGVLTARISQEEQDAARMENLRKAMDEKDWDALKTLMKDPWHKRLWNAMTGKNGKEDTGIAAIDDIRRSKQKRLDAAEQSLANFPYRPVSKSDDSSTFPLKTDREDLLGLHESREAAGKARADMDEWNKEGIGEKLMELAGNETERLASASGRTALRAAEAAGMDTGYIPMSKQDEMASAMALHMDDRAFNMEKDNRSEILSNYRNYLLRANGLASSMAGLAQAGVKPDDPAYKLIEQERNNYIAASRSLRDEGLKAGINPNYFIAENPDEDKDKNKKLSGESLTNAELTDILNKLGLDKNKTTSDNEIQAKLNELGLIVASGDVTELTKLHNGTADSGHANEQKEREAETHKLGTTRTKQEIAAAEEDRKDREYNRNLDDWTRRNPNHSIFQAASIKGNAAIAKAKNYFSKGNYKGVVDALNASADDENVKLAFSVLGFKIGASGNSVTKDGAADAYEAYKAEIQYIEDEVKKMESTMPVRKK